jgi:hypothetical protein
MPDQDSSTTFIELPLVKHTIVYEIEIFDSSSGRKTTIIKYKGDLVHRRKIYESR